MRRKSALFALLCFVASSALFAQPTVYNDPITFAGGIISAKPIVTSPSPGSGYRQITVDPTGTNGYTLQGALTYAIAQSTLAAPWTVTLLPGIYSSDVQINARNATGLVIAGISRGASIVAASKAWLTANCATGNNGFFDVSGANGVTISNLTINGVYGDDGTIGSCANAEAGLQMDNLAGLLTINDADIMGAEYSMAAFAGGSGQRVDIVNSRLYGNRNTVRNASELWHMFSVDLRGMVTATNTGQTGGASGLQSLGSGELDCWGCHIHAEDMRSPAGSAAGVAGVRASNVAGGKIFIVGSTIHVKSVVGDGTGATARFGCLDVPANASSTTVIMDSHMQYETGTVTTGIYGGITMPSVALSSATVKVINTTVTDLAGSGGSQRGAVVRQGNSTVSAGPTMEISGLQTTAPIILPTPLAMTYSTPGRVTGNSTLASGVFCVPLLTSQGNTSETAAVFTNGSASITGGVTFNTIFFAGDFVRLSTDTDCMWTRVKVVTATSLTLEETYPGSSATGTATRGTASASTQPDGTYRVFVEPTAAPAASEVFFVTGKDTGHFKLNSSSGASALNLDWFLTR